MGAYVFIGVGAVTMLMGFLGCIGAVNEVRCLLGLVSSAPSACPALSPARPRLGGVHLRGDLVRASSSPACSVSPVLRLPPPDLHRPSGCWCPLLFQHGQGTHPSLPCPAGIGQPRGGSARGGCGETRSLSCPRRTPWVQAASPWSHRGPLAWKAGSVGRVTLGPGSHSTPFQACSHCVQAVHLSPPGSPSANWGQ